MDSISDLQKNADNIPIVQMRKLNLVSNKTGIYLYKCQTPKRKLFSLYQLTCFCWESPGGRFGFVSIGCDGLITLIAVTVTRYL